MQIARQICAKFCNFDHVSEEFWDETKGLLLFTMGLEDGYRIAQKDLRDRHAGQHMPEELTAFPRTAGGIFRASR
jgi:hypothetical protein